MADIWDILKLIEFDRFKTSNFEHLLVYIDQEDDNMSKIVVKDIDININEEDYISLTNIDDTKIMKNQMML